MNKRGQLAPGWVPNRGDSSSSSSSGGRGLGSLIIGAILIGAVIIVMILLGAYFRETLANNFGKGTTRDIYETSAGPPTSWLLAGASYIIGPVPNSIRDMTDSDTSAIIVIVGIWVLLFVTFSDILQHFSTFGKEVAWVAGGAIAIIAANLNAVAYLTIYFTTFFITLGTIGIFLGLFGAIGAFVVVNLGITYFAPWVLNRKLMKESMEMTLKTQEGANEFAAAVSATKQAGRAFRD